MIFDEYFCLNRISLNRNNKILLFSLEFHIFPPNFLINFNIFIFVPILEKYHDNGGKMNKTKLIAISKAAHAAHYAKHIIINSIYPHTSISTSSRFRCKL